MQIAKKQMLSAFPPLIIGASSVILQILLIQELTAGFYGNELSIGFSLAFWLIWSAAGSALVPGIRKREPGPVEIALIQTAWMLLAGLSLWFISAQKILLHLPSGELPGVIPMLLITAFALAPGCLISGYLYTLMCRWLALRTMPLPSSTVYFLESLGAAAGGITATLLLVHTISPLHVILLLFILNSFSALMITGIKKVPGIATLVFLALLGWKPAAGIQDRFDALKFPDQTVILSRNTPYGHVTLTGMPGQINVFQNGTWFYTTPDLMTSETKVHYALLQHPSPERILLISGGPDLILETLKHPSVQQIDYLEINPFLIHLWRRLMSRPDSLLNNPAVLVHSLDARQFIGRCTTDYDIIISNLPNPYTNQLNRFYTLEFFQQVNARLNNDGIFCFHVQAAENIIHPELADFLSMLASTVRAVFPDLTILPGESQHWLISKHAGTTRFNPDTLESRIQKRNLKTVYVQPYFFLYEYTPERINSVKEHLYSPAPVNTDFFPLGYHFDTVLWATYFSSGFKTVYLALHSMRFHHWAGLVFLFLLTTAGIGLRKKKTDNYWILHSILITGFTEISLEIILILAFQILWGAAFKALSILIAVYMAGLAAGSLIAIKLDGDHRTRLSQFKNVQGIMTLHTGLSAGGLIAGHWMNHTGLESAIPCLIGILMAVSGGVGGFQFIQANRLLIKSSENSRKAGALYGLDLFGSAIGALSISAFLIPILGILNCLFLLILLNGGIWILLTLRLSKTGFT